MSILHANELKKQSADGLAATVALWAINNAENLDMAAAKISAAANQGHTCVAIDYICDREFREYFEQKGYEVSYSPYLNVTWVRW